MSQNVHRDRTSVEVAERGARLVRDFGSPLYVYDADRIQEDFRRFRAAFTYAPVDFHYAIVCNKNRYIVGLLHESGCGVHANTPGDAYAALKAGVPGPRIVFSGSNLSDADFGWLLERGVAVNLDSIDQLRNFAGRGQAAVGLRVFVDDERSRTRIGIAASELPLAIDVCRSARIRLTGLHMYAGTNTLRAERFLACLDRLLQCARAVDELEYVDIGGGFGVPYQDGTEPFPVGEAAAAIGLRMEQLSARVGRRIRLIVEPGRILVARAGCLLMTVVSVKRRGGRRYIGVDTTVGNIVVESVYHARHRVEAAAARGPLLDEPTDVCGNTTHSRDFIARSCRLPQVAPGDLLVLKDVGAYGYAMSSHFLNRPRPAEVVLHGGRAHLTTRRETFEDLVATQLDLSRS
jgi:diaminopimelate decarboxylase